MNLKIHVSNTFLCFNAFGNVGGVRCTHTMHSLTCVLVVVPPPPRVQRTLCPTNTVSNEHFLFGPYFFGT